MPSVAILESKLRRLDKEIDEFEREYSPDGIINRLTKYAFEVHEFRKQGYSFFGEEIEGAMDKIIVMVQQRRTGLNESMDRNIRRLMNELRQASFYTNMGEASESMLEHAVEEVGDAERKLRDARRTYIERLAPLEDVEKRVKKLLRRIPYYFQMKEEASFEFGDDEHVVMADKAEWVVTGKGKDDPDGILFLTNQRIIFEQKEKVGKKFGLFGGKMEHGVQWEYPIDQITRASFEDQGMLGRKDMLMLHMNPDAEHSEITLESKGDDDNSEWHAAIEKAINGKLTT